MFARQGLKRVTSVEDLRSLAEQRLPRAFFQYADQGSHAQSTLRANRRDLEAIELRQRVGISVDTRCGCRRMQHDPTSPTLYPVTVTTPVLAPLLASYRLYRADENHRAGRLLCGRAANRLDTDR
jgi:hypothetical protein